MPPDGSPKHATSPFLDLDPAPIRCRRLPDVAAARGGRPDAGRHIAGPDGEPGRSYRHREPSLSACPTGRGRQASRPPPECENLPLQPGAFHRPGPPQGGGGTPSTDRSVELSQQISIGGKRSLEIRGAEALLADADDRLRRAERLLAATVRAAFVEVLRTRELLEVERTNVELTRNLAEVTRRRLEAGEATQIEMNLALAQVGRDELSLSMVEGAYKAARALLAETIGLPPESLPRVTGTLTVPRSGTPPLSELLRVAATRRADLAAFSDRILAAESARRLRRRQRIPDLRLSASWDREEGTDRIFGAGISLSIPVFNRNRGRIAEADAGLRQTLAEKSAAENRVQREIIESYALFTAASTATRNLEQRVLGSLNQNLDLLNRSLRAGKIGWTEVIVFRREFTLAQRDYVDTVARARLAKIRLDLASGTDLSVLFHEESSR
ncbi:MAG: TolC family protein [Acidobacteriota bacterium]|nr:TolC family protein [Acidobacteriota bacterium]